MAADTKIEWTDNVWNPVRGCSIISPGCHSCYAMRQAHRFDVPGGAYEGTTKPGPHGPQWTGNIILAETKLYEPLKWRKSQRVFVNSMSDLFHEKVPSAFIDQVFAVMALCPQHTFQGHYGYQSFRVGKKAAGRLLDGRQWDEFPSTEAANA